MSSKFIFIQVHRHCSLRIQILFSIYNIIQYVSICLYDNTVNAFLMISLVSQLKPVPMEPYSDQIGPESRCNNYLFLYVCSASRPCEGHFHLVIHRTLCYAKYYETMRGLDIYTW